jgi:hypothetical protein
LFDCLGVPARFWSRAAFTEKDIREHAQKLPPMSGLLGIKPEGIKGFLNGSVVFPNDSVVIVKRQHYGARKIWIQNKRSFFERILIGPLLVFEHFAVPLKREFPMLGCIGQITHHMQRSSLIELLAALDRPMQL